MTNAEISQVFDEIADLLEFTGANQFRVRAYRNAARTVAHLTESLTSIAADSSRAFTDIEGIGKDLALKIEQLLKGEPIPLLNELREQVPKSALELLRIPGLGPKKAALLVKELKINSIDELKAACEAHRVRELAGFGEKTEEKILANLSRAAPVVERIYWSEADRLVSEIIAHLRGCEGVERIESAGSYRRGKETVGDLDFLVVADEPGPIMDRLASFAQVQEVIARGDTKQSVRLAGGLQVDLRVVPAESFGAALQYFTGSKEHNVILRGMAKDRGLKINEYGVFRGEERVAGETEQDVYAALKLPCFPPELREGRQEFAWAEEGELPELIEVDDLVGDLHMHTTATDGKATLEEMIAAAQARGLKYIAITDHSQRVSMANGLTPERALKQWEEIDRLNAKLKGFTVLKGIEVDILERGGLDLPDEVLAQADWVVASVHYGQSQPREQITDRIVGALEHPSVCVIAHPTGRLIHRRQPYAVDLERVMRVAQANGKCLELNANPARLDLDDIHCAAAKAFGIPLVISTAAHSTAGLDQMKYGVLQARRAGLNKRDVANTRSWRELKKMMGRK